MVYRLKLSEGCGHNTPVKDNTESINETDQVSLCFVKIAFLCCYLHLTQPKFRTDSTDIVWEYLTNVLEDF